MRTPPATCYWLWFWPVGWVTAGLAQQLAWGLGLGNSTGNRGPPPCPPPSNVTTKVTGLGMLCQVLLGLGPSAWAGLGLGRLVTLASNITATNEPWGCGGVWGCSVSYLKLCGIRHATRLFWNITAIQIIRHLNIVLSMRTLLSYHVREMADNQYFLHNHKHSIAVPNTPVFRMLTPGRSRRSRFKTPASYLHTHLGPAHRSPNLAISAKTANG